MARFALNPPGAPIGYTTINGQRVGITIEPEWYRFFARTHDALGDDAVAAIQAAPVLTYAATTAFSADKILTQGTGLSFTSAASTLTVGLDTANTRNVDHAAVTLTAGAGLTGGGDITASRTFDIGAGIGITVNANDVALDTTNTRNVDHAAVTLTAGAGLTGGGDITASRTFDIGAGAGITVNANDVALDTASTRNTDHASVTLTAGAGLTGGGDISASRTFDIGAGTGIIVNANDVALDTTSTRNTDHASVTLTAGAGLTGGGDLSASRSFAVGAGTGITVNADDVSLSDMAQATVKGRASGAGTGAPTDLTAAQLVTIINTADGSGSGLDADLLDGMNTSTSGDRWGVIPFVATDGVMEVGRYLDFHNSDADGTDNAIRLDTGGGTSDLYINGNIIARSGSTTVAGLPAAGTVGRRGFVTDASATTFASIVAGGGANGVPVYDDGTNWRIG